MAEIIHGFLRRRPSMIAVDQLNHYLSANLLRNVPLVCILIELEVLCNPGGSLSHMRI